jgi:transposase
MRTATMNDVSTDESADTEGVDLGDYTDDLGKEEQKSRFILLRAKGLSYAKIAKELKVSTSTLTNWNQELLEEIAQAKSMELEALQEEYFMLKEGRIKLLGGQLKTIQEEISGRDFSKVSTERLMEFQLRYFGELKTEYVATPAGDRIGIKLDSSDIGKQLETVLARYRAGEIDESQAKVEQAVLQSMLKGIEQTDLAAKLERLEAVVRSRR